MIELDAIDRKLLGLLQRDARMANQDLARDVDHVSRALQGLLAEHKLRANFQIQVLSSMFFRNKGAYIVGKVINGFTCNVIATNEMIENQQMLLEVALNTKTPIKQYVVKLEAMVDDAGQTAVK